MRYRFDKASGQLVPAAQAVAIPDEAKAEIFSEPKSLGDGRWRLLGNEWIPVGGDNGLPDQKQCEGVQIIKDIDPYKPVAAEKHNGTRPVIGGRRQHREFLRRNGYFEVGNDYVAPRHEEVSTKQERVDAIKRAMNTL